MTNGSPGMPDVMIHVISKGKHLPWEGDGMTGHSETAENRW